MADYNKVDGTSNAAETFSGDLEFVTIAISNLTVRSDGEAGKDAGIDEDGFPNDLEQFLFDKIVEVINQVAQPIVLTGGTTGTDTINFIVEHNSVWSESAGAGAAAPTLAVDLKTMADRFEDDKGNNPFAAATFVVTITATL